MTLLFGLSRAKSRVKLSIAQKASLKKQWFVVSHLVKSWQCKFRKYDGVDFLTGGIFHLQICLSQFNLQVEFTYQVDKLSIGCCKLENEILKEAKNLEK